MAIIDKTLPGMPQYDKFDFFMSLHSFATSIGDVLRLERGDKIFSLTGKIGRGSLLPFTVAFAANMSFKTLLFDKGSFIIMSSFISCGIDDIFWFFIKFFKILNLFFAKDVI